MAGRALMTLLVQRNLRRWSAPVVASIVMTLVIAVGCSTSPRPGSSPEDRVYLHTVQPGETLSDIAGEYYGDPSRASRIGRFNDLRDNAVEPGAVLRIPLTPEDVSRLKNRESAREPYNRGLGLAEKGSYVDAVQEFRNAIAIDPNFVDAHYNLGVSFQKLKSHERALEQFAAVVRLRPDNAQYHYALGNSHFHLERYEEAARAFEHTVERDPHHTKALYSLAVSYEKLGKRDKAIGTWQRYLEVDDKSVWAAEARKRLKNLE
jgi:tetratricopeptide (TPR) repeat protein